MASGEDHDDGFDLPRLLLGCLLLGVLLLGSVPLGAAWCAWWTPGEGWVRNLALGMLPVSVALTLGPERLLDDAELLPRGGLGAAALGCWFLALPAAVCGAVGGLAGEVGGAGLTRGLVSHAALGLCFGALLFGAERLAARGERTGHGDQV